MRPDDKISYWIYESALARADQRFREMWVLVLILIILLVGSNIGWVCYESQFTDEITTIESSQDGSGVNIVGGGDVSYGTDSKDNN